MTKRTGTTRRLPTGLILVRLSVAFGGLPAVAGDPVPGDASSQARIDEILTQLEKRGDDLKDIRCKVRFVEEDRVNLSKQVKTGDIRFLMTDTNPLFMIFFERTVVDEIVGKREWYLFDGRWLSQGLERLQQVTKQEYAREGETIDLFDLETAPFPLPFGQKKEKIRKNFDVTLLPPVEGDPPNTDHLSCAPKAESPMHRKYDRLEFFVMRDVHLPSRILVVKNDGYESNTADFPDLTAKSINTGLTKKDFDPPSEWRKYKEVVEPLPPTPPSNPVP